MSFLLDFVGAVELLEFERDDKILDVLMVVFIMKVVAEHV